MESGKPPSFDLKQLFYFICVAENGSISRGAATLGIAQPTLSEHIARLEEKLEVTLILRGAHGIQLTDAGASLLNHGREILKSVNEATADARHMGSEARGPISVGLPPSLGLLLTVPLAETIQNELPLVRLRIAEGMSGDVLDWVLSGKVDLGCVFDIPDSSHLSVHPVLVEELFLVTAPDNWPEPILPNGRASQPINLADIKEVPLVMTSRPEGTREMVERFARSNSIKLNVVTEIDSLPPIISLVDRASAYTILPHAAVMREVAAGTLALVPIVKPTLRRTTYLIRKRARPVSRAGVTVEAAISTILREAIQRFQLEARLINDE